MWVLDHLDDLDADFRVYYRIDGVGDEDFGDMTGPRFFALASRLPAYGGLMAAVAARRFADLNTDEDLGPEPLQANPVLAGLIDYN